MGKNTLTKADNPAENQDKMIAGLADKWRDKKGSLIMALHDVQSHYGYVPRDVARKLAHQLDVPLARIYEVITFYNYFKLTPPGKHRISVCLGTACYLKGAPELIAEVESLLGIKEGQTTSDGLFQMDVVRCLGCCGLAPVMTVSEEEGNKVYAKLSRKQVAEIIAKYSKPGAIEKNEKLNKEDIFAASKTNPYSGDYVKIGLSTCGVAAGAQDTLNVFEEETKRLGIKVDIRRCGCIGMCYAEPLVEVSAAGLPKVTYGKVDKNVALEIIQEHLAHGRLVNDYIFDMPMNR